MNPYHNLPAENYWRTGVQIPARSESGYANLWHAKFPITRDTKIITLGSCFAQHISKWMKAHGFSWVDSEPGNSNLSQSELEENGYGIFSFRVGNIYTPALLKQWIFQALQLQPELDEVFLENGRYYDAFRPLIPAHGYDSAEEVRAARQGTLAAIRRALLEADLLIFTLGLTEGWKHANGYAYPMCPGTVKGDFRLTEHQFINYQYEDVLGDLTSAMDAIVAINPRMKFLLTVSPVPLTATAETQHVLSATTYSKSVLRAAAGALANERANVDYFPSYELIAQFPSQGKFYESNLRSVKKDGVDFVMRHFEWGIGLADQSQTLPLTKPVTPPASKEPTSVEEYCEDILLEEWNSTRINLTHPELTQVFLVGDSHLDATSGALTQIGISNLGGMIMRGHTWANSGFGFDAEEIFVPLDGVMARQKWSQTFSGLSRSKAARKFLITNIGLQTNVNVPRLYQWAKERHLSEVRAEHIQQFFQEINAKNIALIQKFLAHGLRCLVISDPPTQSLHSDFEPLIPWFALYERVALNFYAQLGCMILSVREAYPRGVPDSFYSTQLLGSVRDWVHGSPDYYAALAQLIAKRLSNELKAS